MGNQTQKTSYVIRRIVELGQGEQIPIHRAFGPQAYQAVGQEIIESGFRVPAGYKTAPLVHAAYCSPAKDEPEFKNVRELVRNRWLWVFNQNIYTPEGMYSIHDEKAHGRSETFKVKALEKMLKGGKEHNSIHFSKDGRVAFAPVGSYTLGKQTLQSLITQGDVIAQYGIHGAQLLGRAN